MFDDDDNNDERKKCKRTEAQINVISPLASISGSLAISCQQILYAKHLIFFGKITTKNMPNLNIFLLSNLFK